MYDVSFYKGDILFEDADFRTADNYQQVQNIIRNVLLTRRGSLPYNITYGSDLLHSKAASEIAEQNLNQLAKYITDDMLYSIWLVHPTLANKIRADYVVDEEHKTITWRFYVQDEGVFVPIQLDVGTVQTQLGLKLVFT